MNIFNEAIDETINIDGIQNHIQFKKVKFKLEDSGVYKIIDVISSYLRSVADYKIDIKCLIDKFVMSRYNDKIEDYLVVLKQIKTGIDVDPIFYGSEENMYLNLNKLSNIRNILELEENNYPNFYIYFMPKNDIYIDDDFRIKFLKDFGKFIAEEFNNNFKIY